MILDFDTEFTEGEQAIVATAVGNHVLDAGANNTRDYGAGEPGTPYIKTGNAADFNNLTSLQVDIIASDAQDGTGNPVVLSTRTILLAALLKSKLFWLPALMPGIKRRCLVAKFTVNGANPAAGTVICGIRPKGGSPQNVVNSV
jgi:hypothetical protein